MTANDWIQFVLYFVVLAALAKPLGWYMARVYRGQALLRIGPRAGLAGARDLSRLRHRPQTRDGLEAVHRRRAAVQRSRVSGRLCAAAAARHVAAQSAKGFAGNTSGLGVQHGRQLCHEHQLAGLRRRNDDELSVADARTDGAELCLGRVGHGGARGADPRIGATHRAQPSATSGTTWSASTLYILLPLSIVVALVLVSQGVIQNFKSYDTANAAPADDRCRWHNR